jgi:hypothetical protein
MGQLVLITVAAQQTTYSTSHIALLLRQRRVAGEKVGGIWMVDLVSLKAYEAAMQELGSKKFDPTKPDQ